MLRSQLFQENSAIVAEPRRTPAEIVAEAARAADAIRQSAIASSLTQWRTLVFSIAAGEETTSDELATIARLADCLRLPAGALSRDVAAAVEEKRIAEELRRSRAVGAAAEARAPLMQRETEEATRRLNDLKAEACTNFYDQGNPAWAAHRHGDFRDKHPILFGDAEGLAARMVMEVAR